MEGCRHWLDKRNQCKRRQWIQELRKHRMTHYRTARRETLRQNDYTLRFLKDLADMSALERSISSP